MEENSLDIILGPYQSMLPFLSREATAPKDAPNTDNLLNPSGILLVHTHMFLGIQKKMSTRKFPPSRFY
jgi:hypothetical protein